MRTSPLLLAGVKLYAEASENLQFPITVRLYAYWKAKRGTRLRPRWSDFNLMDIYDSAPYICVRDVLPGEDDFLCRYWGTRLGELYGVDCTGKRIADTYPPPGVRHTLDIYRSALSSETPLRVVGNLGYVGRSELKHFEGVFLRLDGKEEPDRHVIGAFDFDCDLDAADLAKLEGPGTI